MTQAGTFTGQRVGVFGGTFDPPHIGHLVTALNVSFELQLDRMLLVVANQPWQKVGTRVVTEARHRLAMVQQAVADLPGVEASAIEIERGGVTYTIDTLETIWAGGAREVVLVVGRDAASGIDTWERADEVRQRARLVVVERPGSPSEPLEGFESVATPELGLSSTDLRRRFAEGAPVRFLVPDPVIAYAEDHRLYRSSDV